MAIRLFEWGNIKMSVLLSPNLNYKNDMLHLENLSLVDLSLQVKTPFYAYSYEDIKVNYLSFANAFKTRKGYEDTLIAYAIKANPNLSIIKMLGELGAGADTVSEGEIRRALRAGIDPKKIVFAGVGKTKDELRFALATGVGQFNVESEAELMTLDIEAEKMGVIANVALRINPDVEAKTLKGIATGRKGDKFGIPVEQAKALVERQSAFKHCKLNGLAVHIGSQILDIEDYKRAYLKLKEMLLDLRKKGHKITHLDLGGGIGVQYSENDKPIEINDFAHLVFDIFDGLDVKLAFEPGRFIMANAGVLVTEVVYIKQSQDWHCLIVDSAMNDMARSAMYGAWHEIVPVSHFQDRSAAPDRSYDIVGPVCETTDTFAKSRTLPSTRAGDLLAIQSVGAYGSSMSSNYNSRLGIPEVLVHGNDWKIIRKRPDYDMIFALEE